jgi:biopolymer transport protein ExbD
VDVAVDLPASNAKQQQRPDEPVFLTVKGDLSLALGNEPIGRESLAATLDQRTGSDRDERIFLRADKAVAYGDLMEIMNLLRQAGYLKVALVGLEAVPDPASRVPSAPAADSIPR